MSGGGRGGAAGARVSSSSTAGATSSSSSAAIPSNVKKTIQHIKEITGNHSEDEIYSVLKECSMDPNETIQKLLLHDPFHEVKRKRDKKKEGEKMSGGGRGGAGARVSSSSTAGATSSSAAILSNVKKTIQHIKEITGNLSEDEIYSVLKECSMDPNETAQKLLLLDTFHEVVRKRDKKKESFEGQQEGTYVETMVSWYPPRQDWVKLNTDGAAKGNPGNAGGGGVIRDGYGAWCVGYAGNIGMRVAVHAEVLALWYGLQVAWQKGYRKVVVETDSQQAVKFLSEGVAKEHSLSDLVTSCRSLIDRDWQIEVTHIFREGNRVADSLANLALSLQLGWHVFLEPPVVCNPMLEQDRIGVAWPRRVRSDLL